MQYVTDNSPIYFHLIDAGWECIGHHNGLAIMSNMGV